MSRIAPRIVVVGSLNIDYIAAVEKLPAAGETVFATGLVQRFGGKGANQAMAAAAQGAKVSMIGCVGADDHGRAYCKRLRGAGIHAAGIATTKKALTGTALIAVDKSAENVIVVAPGANNYLSPTDLLKQRRLIAAAHALLLQQEIPTATIVEAIRMANRAKVPVFLNPSPLRKDFPWGKVQIEVLIANEGEAQAIFGKQQSDWQRRLAPLRINRAIVTRGAKPTMCFDTHQQFQVPTIAVKPVDTVGAGDAFAGAFVACYTESLNRAGTRSTASDSPILSQLLAAIRLANCAGALATLKPGAQESIPSRIATEKAARQLNP